MSVISNLAAAIRRGLAELDAAFRKLNRIQFEAPWRSDGPTRC